jgi:hypothetical protein
MIGKPCARKSHARFDEGELEIEPRPLRQFPTLPLSPRVEKEPEVKMTPGPTITVPKAEKGMEKAPKKEKGKPIPPSGKKKGEGNIPTMVALLKRKASDKEIEAAFRPQYKDRGEDFMQMRIKIYKRIAQKLL